MQVTISGIHTKVDADLTKYVNKKIGRLEHYLTRAARESAVAEVKLKDSKAKGKQQHSCEVILSLPKDRLVVEETTVNPFAAVDIAENALRAQILKHKQRHAGGKLYHRLRRRLDRFK